MRFPFAGKPFIFPRMDYFEMERARVCGLAHENINVRSTMLHTFDHHGRVPEEATGIALEQIDKYGWEKAYVYSHQIAKLPHTRESLEWAVAAFSSDLGQAVVGDRVPWRIHILSWLGNAPVEWFGENLGRLRNELLGSPALKSDPEYAQAVGGFLQTAETIVNAALLEGAALRERICGLVALCAEKEEFPHTESGELETLCVSAAVNRIFTDAELLAWLEAPFADGVDESDDKAGYFATAALLILAEGGGSAPVGAVVRLLEIDWEWTNELISKSLERTADRESVAEILELYPTLKWHARLYLSGMLESVRFPGFEEDFQAAYLQEEDLIMKTRFAHILALHGTESGLVTVRRHLREYGDFSESGPLRDLFLCQEIVLGRETGETKRHLQVMEQERKRMDEASAQVARLFATPKRAPALHDGMMGQLAVQRLPQRLPALVGRNDRCPCGSGKKYKKCCG